MSSGQAPFAESCGVWLPVGLDTTLDTKPPTRHWEMPGKVL